MTLAQVPFCRAEEAAKVSVCRLKQDPPAWNRKLVEVTGFATHASRDFTLTDPTCPSWPAIWLEYGGTLNTGTVNCCRTWDDRRRPEPLVVENLSIPLDTDASFQAFDQAVQPPFRPGQAGAVEHATLIGRFFAGQQLQDSENGRYWGGYGHMGCCSMLAIQQVKDPDTEPHPDLDYGESNEKLNLPSGACSLRMLLPEEQSAAFLEAQHQAESGTRAWAFTDPARVAAEALTPAAKADPAALQLTHDSLARKTYQSTTGPRRFTVTVSRPYWMSFYAHDPKQVAWVAAVAYEVTCGNAAQ